MTHDSNSDVIVMGDRTLVIETLAFGLTGIGGLPAITVETPSELGAILSESAESRVVIVEHAKPRGRAQALIEQMIAAWPMHRFIVISGAERNAGLAQRLRLAGAYGFVPMSLRLPALTRLIGEVKAGDRCFPTDSPTGHCAA